MFFIKEGAYSGFVSLSFDMDNPMTGNPEILAARREVAVAHEAETPNLCLHHLFGVCRFGAECHKSHGMSPLDVQSKELFAIAAAVAQKEKREQKAAELERAYAVFATLSQEQRDALQVFNPGRIRPKARAKSRASSIRGVCG